MSFCCLKSSNDFHLTRIATLCQAYRALHGLVPPYSVLPPLHHSGHTVFSWLLECSSTSHVETWCFLAGSSPAVFSP